jgi:predicted metal-dependent phosphoesterase TrpH
MDVDLHTHTYPASTCSEISHPDYVAACRSAGVRAIALTNHGRIDDNRELEPVLRHEGVILLHGVEVSTPCGDFVIYSPDLEYLATFRDVQDLPDWTGIPDHAAVVWVHPTVGGGRSRARYSPAVEAIVAPLVDAIEVYNGSWLQDEYVRGAERIATTLGLPRTGGSDAHTPQAIMSCFTEIPGEVAATEDLVKALRNRATTPHRGASLPPKRRFRLFG